ncbi:MULTISPECIES: 30S ribosomal protein S7 [Holospora]|uniref:Small ribosomal subunit protein uS7 n=2 Tax=Holospora TaxID=44747 RepID=A0A061JHG6_9PROT|nr:MULTISPECIES: 30S ribosomal protein S7 [Holospora]ETZ04827.1 30S ribosomal protein S7 [Holospora undulata HU1]GAJ46364.1 30S ribosomal protein S7 [Holospora elegans E1]
MARRHRSEKREITPDLRYEDSVIAKFINCLMWKGKKTIAQNIVYDALDRASAKLQKDPKELFHAALGNVRPNVEVRARRVGGATYTVPVAVSVDRGQILALRWLIHYARLRPEKTMKERLGEELRSAAEGTGGAVKKRSDTHKMAEANRAFSHYRF